MKSIVEIAEFYGVELKENGEILSGFCCFHEDTGRPNLVVYPQTESFFCFACGIGGNREKFIAEIEGISYSDAKKKLAGEKIELEELQEMIDGVGIHDEPTQLNDELNILVSKTLRKIMKDHPQKITEIMEFAKSFDEKLTKPIYYNEMQKLLKELHFFSEKLYN